MNAERGSMNPCPVCGIAVANQHSNKQSGLCDGLKSGKLRVVNGKYVGVKPHGD